MRSGSTLLLHLLLTSPELISAGERNAVYRTATDLDGLEVSSRWSHRAPFRRVRYTVDQVNHDRFIPVPDLLSHPRVRPLFLIREPLPTIRSILELTRTYYDPWSAERAVGYYAGRLRTLAAYAASIRSQSALAVTHEALVRDTSRTLGRIESFLGLDQQLRAEYTVQRFTGIRGDPSPAIRSGKIQTETVELETSLPNDLLNEAMAAYRDCMSALDRFLPCKRGGLGSE